MYKDINFLSKDSTGINAVNQSIKNILLTSRGSVPGKPRFGSDLHKLTFSPMNHLIESIAKNYIIEAITEFEDRINVEEVEIILSEVYNKIIINISFSYNSVVLEGNNVINTTSVSYSL
jgi:phage baseplate assembly protein W